MAPRRYRGYVARKLLDQHTYQGEPQSVEQLLELTKVEASKLANGMHVDRIPIKVEHAEKMVDVGRVINAGIEKESDGTQNLVAEFEIDEHASAALVGDCVDNFALNCLSLTHLKDSLKPIELSICKQGARPGTVIIGRKNFKEFLQSRGEDMAVSASVQQYHPDVLNAQVYKTIYTSDSAIRASAMEYPLVRSPEGESKHIPGLGAANDLEKLMSSVLPPNGAHPFSSPAEQKAMEDKRRQEHEMNQMKQAISYMFQHIQQQQQQTAKPPLAAAQVSASAAPMQVDSTPAPPAQAPQQQQQQQQQQQPLDPLLVAESIAKPSRGLMSDVEKANAIRTLHEQTVALQHEKARANAASQELEKMKKAFEEADKKAEEAKKQNAEMKNTVVEMMSKMQTDPETVEALKKAAATEDNTALAKGMYNVVLSASNHQQATQERLKALESLAVANQQQQQEQQKRDLALHELQMFRNNLNLASSFPSSLNYSAPIIQASASTQALQNPVSQARPINPLAADYYNDQVIQASRAMYLKQNSGNMNNGIANDKTWKLKPYQEGSIIDRVFKDDSPQYMGKNNLDTFDVGAVIAEAQAMAMHQRGGVFPGVGMY